MQDEKRTKTETVCLEFNELTNISDFPTYEKYSLPLQRPTFIFAKRRTVDDLDEEGTFAKWINRDSQGAWSER